MLAVPAYALSTVLTKCAICVYFFRLTISREVRIIAYATMALAAGQCLTLSVNTITCAASTKNLSTEELVVMGVLMGGGFVFGVSVYRAYQAFHLFRLGSIYSEWTSAALWCNVELLFGLIRACLPAAKALFNHAQKAKRSGTSLRQIKLCTLTQPEPGALPSQGALGGGGVVRLGSSDPTTAYKESNFTAKHSNSHNHNSSIHGFERR
ncbi:hypothetical protein RB598_002124 [Gaeumannomyces tritici]